MLARDRNRKKLRAMCKNEQRLRCWVEIYRPPLKIGCHWFVFRNPLISRMHADKVVTPRGFMRAQPQDADARVEGTKTVSSDTRCETYCTYFTKLIEVQGDNNP